MTGTIFDIKEFAIHDGAGIRTTVFMKGCPLKCLWCHNPEGQSAEPELMQKSGCTGCGRCRSGCSHDECTPFGRCVHACPNGLLKICGERVDSAVIAGKLAVSADIFIQSGGGVTVSGGEPLMQWEFVCDLLRRLGELKIHRAVETCGYSSEKAFDALLSCTDFVYCDLKLADSAAHLKYTGRENEPILKNIARLRESGVPYKIRVPLIPGITDTRENLSAVRSVTDEHEVEYLKYNPLAGAKYPMLGREYKL